jgi:protein-S-isoprenylcysteine O-methyltransferase Ste14
MSRGIVTSLFGLLTASFVYEAVQVWQSAILAPSFQAWAVAAHALLWACVFAAFTVFVVLRAPPRRPSREPLAFAAALLGMWALVALRQPDGEVNVALVVIGDVILVVAAAWMLASILSLGRCFGVLPEARGLVTHGPYRFVRHPLYLAEFGICAGLVVAAPSLWNVAVAAVFASAQSVRMMLEERALGAEFPAYARYAAVTPRLVPRLWRPQLEYHPAR